MFNKSKSTPLKNSLKILDNIFKSLVSNAKMNGFLFIKNYCQSLIISLKSIKSKLES
jgi:hypothetical protein